MSEVDWQELMEIEKVVAWTADQLELVRNSNDEINRLKTALHWGTYGPSGDGELEKKPLCDLETTHLENILITQRQIPPIYSFVILAILKDRHFQEFKKVG